MSAPQGNSGNDTVFLEVVIRLRPSDPSIGSQRQPLEATRDALLAAAKTPTRSEATPEPAPVHLAKTERARKLESDIARDAEKTLKAMTHQAMAAVTDLMQEATVRAAANVLVYAEQALHDAQARTAGAYRLINENWAKYVPSPEECVKDIIKYSVRVVILYAVWQAITSFGS